MELSGCQELVARFVEEGGVEAPVQARVLDLVSEVGELAKEALRGSGYGRDAFQRTEGWAGELGDALFSLICLANSTDVDLESALKAALDRYRVRLARAGDAGSGR